MAGASPAGESVGESVGVLAAVEKVAPGTAAAASALWPVSRPSRVRSSRSSSQRVSTSGWTSATRLPAKRQGVVTKVMSASLMPCRDCAKSTSFIAVPRPASTVSARVAASASGSSVVREKPWPCTFLIIEERKACWRFIRPMSELSPKPYRARRKSTAGWPDILCGPWLRWMSWESTSLGTQTSTPLIASVIAATPRKSTTTVWSIRRPVSASTVFCVQAGLPCGKSPTVKAELNICSVRGVLHRPSASLQAGTVTRVSRGIDTPTACRWSA